MQKRYWWTKIPYTEKKRKKSDFELLTEFVYFYRKDQFLDFEVAQYVNLYLSQLSDITLNIGKNLLIDFSESLNRNINSDKISRLEYEDVVQFLKTYEEEILVG